MRVEIFSRAKSKLTLLLTLIILAGFTGSGCVYFNTFYNAKQAFGNAEKARKKQKTPGAKGNRNDYERAIEKALKVVENHPKSRYYDDALYILGVSYYYTDQYTKSERRMREILANFPNSKYRGDAELYVAKAQLVLKENEEAMETFSVILQEGNDKKSRAEAAGALGNYYFENKEYQQSRQYFLALRDSLGEESDRIVAQQYIADSYFETFHFADALSSYLQMLGMKPNTTQKYHALSRSATCAYRLQRIDDGIDYLTTLLNDPLYFDSVGVLKLRLAEGSLRQENLPGAETMYLDIIDHEKAAKVIGEAFYELGLIAQFDYDDLVKAKKYYDTAATLMGRSASDIGQDALQRGSDIGKLSQYRQKYVFDSTTTEEKLEQAAETQLLLADLYWYKLNKPDSAMIEVKYIIDSIPSEYVIPEAMIRLSSMVREYESDSAKADSILWEVIRKYPKSDDVGRAIALLGLSGSAADTGYAEHYVRQAERCIVDEEKPDSAKYYFEQVIEQFPESKFVDQARFAVIWIDEEYHNPGDSTIYYAYQEYLDSFPTSAYATVARNRITPTGAKKKGPRDDQLALHGDTTQGAVDTIPQPAIDVEKGVSASNTDVLGTFSGIYIGPDGDTLELLRDPRLAEIRDTFAFPVQAQAYADPQYQLYFQIKLDFSGKVEEYILKNPTNIPEINEEAESTVASMIFDVSSLPDRQRNTWVVYKFIIVRPDFLR